MEINLAGAIHRQAMFQPDSPALAVGPHRWASYAQLSQSVARLAGALHALSRWQTGARVVLLMENHPSFWEVLFATWHAGGCCVPLNSKLHPNEVAQILIDCEPAVVVTSQRLSSIAQSAIEKSGLALSLLECDTVGYLQLREHTEPIALVERKSQAPAWIFFTSGTTGKAKGAILSHGNLQAMCAAYYADIDFVQPRDRFIHAAAVSHGSGLYGLAFFLKGALNVIPDSGSFDPAETCELIAHWSRASLFLAPTMLNRIVRSDELAGRARDHLRTLVYGGGPMYVADLERALHALGPCLAQIYGQGESPMTITALAKWQHQAPDRETCLARLASVGSERFGTQVHVVDEHGRKVETGQPGEIIVRGDTVMQGYLNDTAATDATLRDGWLYTGDIGSFDAHGYLTLCDRSKDVVISGGANVYPREVEEVLLRHPDVIEAAVFGIPDPQWGEITVCAYVSAAPPATIESELDRLCLDSIARFKRPKRYFRLAELPKNNYGKVPKRELARLFLEQDVSAKPGAPP